MPVRVDRGSDYVLVRGPFRVLSSAAFNGGYREAEAIANVQVSKDFDYDYRQVFQEFGARLSLRNFVGLLTAAPVAKSVVASEDGVTVVVSAGLGQSLRVGTVNAIVVVERDLTSSAMVNVVIVASEAKAAAFRDLDLRAGVEPATGTVTDAVAVACTGHESVEFAGPATEVGQVVTRLVARGVKEALASMEGITASRPLPVRLEERGITLESIVAAALALWAPSAEYGSSRRQIAARFRRMLARHLADVNVAAFLEAAFLLEDALRAGRLPVKGDPVDLMADDVMGLTLAEYLAGKRAVFNFERYDHAKPGVIANLGPFLDDAIAGLIAGTMTKAFEP